jgi:hypothetical protein
MDLVDGKIENDVLYVTLGDCLDIIPEYFPVESVRCAATQSLKWLN